MHGPLSSFLPSFLFLSVSLLNIIPINSHTHTHDVINTHSYLTNTRIIHGFVAAFSARPSREMVVQRGFDCPSSQSRRIPVILCPKSQRHGRCQAIPLSIDISVGGGGEEEGIYRRPVFHLAETIDGFVGGPGSESLIKPRC